MSWVFIPTPWMSTYGVIFNVITVFIMAPRQGVAGSLVFRGNLAGVTEMVQESTNNSTASVILHISVTPELTTYDNTVNDTSFDDHRTTSEANDWRILITSGVMSPEGFDMLRKLRSQLGLFLALSGCLLNGLAVIVYARMPAGFVNRFLICLQVLDFLFLLCTFYPIFLILIRGSSAGKTKFYQYYALYVNNYLYTCIQRTSVFCTAVLSVNRCIVMLAPFNQVVKKLFKYPARIIISTQTVTFVSSLYVILKTRVGKLTEQDGSERYTLVPTDAFKANRRIFEDFKLMNTFLFTYVPAIGSFIANICMVIGLVLMSRKKANAGDKENKKFFKMSHQKTLVILVYSTFSLVLLLPFMSIPILARIVPGFGVMQKEHYMYISMGSIIALCDITRSAMGFFVFVGLSSSFRGTFIALILRKDKSKAVNDGN